MGIRFKSGRTPRDAAISFRNRTDKVTKESRAIGRIIAGEAEKELRRRDWPARSVNRQDAPGGRPILGRRRNTQVRVKQDGEFTTVTLRVLPVWTGARSRALVAIFAALGLTKKLARTALYVVRTGGRKLRARNKIADGAVPQKVLFSKAPRLRAWAERAEKGLQAKRHQVRVTGEALRRLVLAPTMKDCRGKVLEWRDRVRKALFGGA